MSELQNELSTTLDNRYLVFSIGGTDYAMEITYIIEIIEMLPITHVPGIPSFITGIINLRGSVIPVVDARSRFGYEPAEYTEHTCILVLQEDDISVGLIVDSVEEVNNIMPDEISEPPSDTVSGENLIKGIGKACNNVQLIIDCNKLLDCTGAVCS